MKNLICNNCGATGMQIMDGYAICDYCNSKFVLTAEDFGIYNFSQSSSRKDSLNNSTGISLGNDIQMLLQKCRLNPRNARKYANLILDIDPDNEEALKYL